ncbi:glycosyl hydrolase family 28-related protein [Caballeronia sp. KNU42]
MTKIIFPSGNAYSDDGSAERDMLDGGHTEYLLPMLGETIGAAQMALDAVPEALGHASEAATARDGARAERDAAAAERAGATDEHAGAAAERAEAAKSAAAARADAASVHMPALAGKAGRVLGVSVDESAMEWTDLSPLAKLGDLASPDKGAALIGFKPSSKSSIARTVADELNDGYANPKRFGAKGNDSAEDSVPIQTAIEELAARGGGVVRFPLGNYRCNLVGRTGVSFSSGSGMFGYLPAAGGPVSGVTLAQAAPGFVIDTPDSLVTNIAIEGINFRGLGATYAGGGVRLRNVKWSVIKKCSSNYFADQGFQHLAGFGVTFEDLLTTNVLLNRARKQADGAVEMLGTDDTMCRVEANPSLTGIVSDDLFICAIVIGGANNWVDTGTVGEFAERGVYIKPQAGAIHKLTAVRADHNVGVGFYVDGSALWSLCHAYNNSTGSPGDYSGFYSSTKSAGNTFSACRSDGISGAQQKWGFEDLVNNSLVDLRNTYVVPKGAYNAAGLVTTQGFLGSAVIAPPTVIRPLDATAIIDVTGTTMVVLDNYQTATSVTNFTGGANGDTISVKGNARVTIVNGLGINTGGAGSVVMSNNKMYDFTQYNGTWYMR